MSRLDTTRVFVVAADSEAAWEQRISGLLRSSARLASSVDSADVVLVVIAPGRPCEERRFIRAVAHALNHSKHLVPLLVNGAEMPPADRLPSEIRPLGYHQALAIRNEEAIPGVVARAIASRPDASTEVSRPVAPSVFVSYRRDDSGYWAGLLARALMAELGPGQVWFDTGSERAGTDYRRQIDAALAACRQVIVVIGPGFLATDRRGHRRIDSHGDLVRVEIRSALQAGKPIRVVLTGGVDLPQAAELPDDLVGLSSVASILRLAQDSDAASVARELATAPTAAGPLQFNLFRSRTTASAADRVLSDWRARKAALERHAEWVSQQLETFGWTVTSERFDQHTIYELSHPEHSSHRIVIEAGTAEVLLQEKSHAVRRAGLRRWTTRAVFAVSPRSPDPLALLQLPERLVEAALDPDAYLERIGRGRVSSRTRKKFMGEDRLLANVEAMGLRPPPDAVEGYHKTRRDIGAGGGLRQLVLESEVEIPDSAIVAALATHPHGPLTAVAGDTGVFLIDPSTGDQVKLARFGSYSSIAYSRTGRLAAATNKGKIDVWESDGRPLIQGASPYSLTAKARLARTYEARSLHTLSWSDDGEQLAGAAADSVWVWQGSGFDERRWVFPDDPERNLNRGAIFLPGGKHLLVFGMFRHLWLLETSTMEAIASLELKGAPSHIDHLIRGEETPPQSSSAFTSINAAAVASDGTTAACAGDAGQTALCDLQKMTLIGKLTWHVPVVGSTLPLPNSLQTIAFSPDGRWLASAGRDRRIVVGDATTWQPKFTVQLEGLATREILTWSFDSAFVAAVNRSHLQFWRLT